MPHGELYIRTKRTITAHNNAQALHTGMADLTVNNATYKGWVDAYDRYGLSLEDGALGKLMAPAPNKKPVGNNNVMINGVAYLGGTIGVKDERSLSLDVHIMAASKPAFLSQYGLLCSEVLDAGYIQVRTSYQPDVIYHLIYQDCQQYSQYARSMAKFTLAFIEPHPEYRIHKQSM